MNLKRFSFSNFLWMICLAFHLFHIIASLKFTVAMAYLNIILLRKYEMNIYLFFDHILLLHVFNSTKYIRCEDHSRYVRNKLIVLLLFMSLNWTHVPRLNPLTRRTTKRFAYSFHAYSSSIHNIIIMWNLYLMDLHWTKIFL